MESFSEHEAQMAVRRFSAEPGKGHYRWYGNMLLENDAFLKKGYPYTHLAGCCKDDITLSLWGIFHIQLIY
jgi:hypothetical protein